MLTPETTVLNSINQSQKKDNNKIKKINTESSYYNTHSSISDRQLKSAQEDINLQLNAAKPRNNSLKMLMDMWVQGLRGGGSEGHTLY